MSILTTLPLALYDGSAFRGFAKGPEFSMQNARAMAWLCQLAYETRDRDKVEAILATWGATFVEPGIVSASVSTPLPLSRTDAFLARYGDMNLLAFAGTDPVVLPNWITDFRFHPDAAGIAEGFADAARSILPAIEMALAGDRESPLCVTGHSLGGALAVVAAASLAAAGFRIEAIYTFGMPRPGTEDFKCSYDQALGARTYRLVHAADIVPTVAPSWLGQRHVGRLLPCQAGRKFDAATLAADTVSDDPAFADQAIDSLLNDLRRPWQRSERLFEAFQRVLDPHFAASGGGRSDLVGLVIETLPAPLRDHLPDRYIAAVE